MVYEDGKFTVSAGDGKFVPRYVCMDEPANIKRDRFGTGQFGVSDHSE